MAASILQNKEEEQEAAKFDAVFPCILSILPAAVFNKKDPIIVGVDIVEGVAKVRHISSSKELLCCLDLHCCHQGRANHHHCCQARLLCPQLAVTACLPAQHCLNAIISIDFISKMNVAG